MQNSSGDSEQAFELNARASFLNIFRPSRGLEVHRGATPSAEWRYYPDPFGQPFRPAVAFRCILYPLVWDGGRTWRDAIRFAAKAMGDQGWFMTYTEHAPGVPWHHYVPLGEQDAEDYVVLPLEYALYSPSSQWGLLVSHGEHAVAGGTTPEFTSSLNGALQVPLSDQQDKFLADMREQKRSWPGADLHWVPTLLSHLYGIDAAQRLLREYELTALLE